MRGGIPLKDVSKKYNATKKIWNAEDYWHFHLHERYKGIIQARKDLFTAGRTLNIGSASEDYDIRNPQMIFLDVAERSLPRDRSAVCGDAHRLPFGANSFQSAIAIGSVLNYCVPTEFFIETARILREGGFLLFDFEQSGAFEHQGKTFFEKRAALFETDFNDLEETIWVFGKDHIIDLLKASGFRLVEMIHIHSLSSLVWRLTENNSFTVAACKLDSMFCKIPFFRERSSSVFIIAQKTSSRSA